MRNINLVALDQYADINEAEFFEAIQRTLASDPHGPLIIVFPEAVLNTIDKAQSRVESKRILARVNQLLATHGNAFLFTSFIEKVPKPNGRYSVSNTGYIVLPSKRKAWFAYPKATYYTSTKSPTMMDTGILAANSSGKVKYADLRAHWVRRAHKVREYPQIRINGLTIQLRVCADVSNQPSGKFLPQGKPQTKADLIIVPAGGYPLGDFHFSRLPLKSNGSVIVVDGIGETLIANTRSPRLRRMYSRLEASNQFNIHRNRLFRLPQITTARRTTSAHPIKAWRKLLRKKT